MKQIIADCTESEAVIIGVGPAGLMAAEQLANAGYQVNMFDAMPSVGRKFLRAGIGGLNLAHAEPIELFGSRYTPSNVVSSWLSHFDADRLRAWAMALGIETFVGSSGRIFPVEKKASPLLRAWLQRIHQSGVKIHTRSRWTGFKDGLVQIQTPAGMQSVRAKVVVLALGGGSWARLGSDGSWQHLLSEQGVEMQAFTPSNCGFDYQWSEHLRNRFAGSPLKTVALRIDAEHGHFQRQGEAVISSLGVQGALIYHASSLILRLIDDDGQATVYWDLLPDKTAESIAAALLKPRGKESMANYLRKRLGIHGVKAALLYELAPPGSLNSAEALAGIVKRLPQTLRQARPLDEAISTGGGVSLNAIDAQLMLKQLPGVFCAGEMLAWDAPTGGYLLTACMASGLVAGQGAVGYLEGL